MYLVSGVWIIRILSVHSSWSSRPETIQQSRWLLVHRGDCLYLVSIVCQHGSPLLLFDCGKICITQILSLSSPQQYHRCPFPECFYCPTLRLWSNKPLLPVPLLNPGNLHSTLCLCEPDCSWGLVGMEELLFDQFISFMMFSEFIHVEAGVRIFFLSGLIPTCLYYPEFIFSPLCEPLRVSASLRLLCIMLLWPWMYNYVDCSNPHFQFWGM